MRLTLLVVLSLGFPIASAFAQGGEGPHFIDPPPQASTQPQPQPSVPKHQPQSGQFIAKGTLYSTLIGGLAATLTSVVSLAIWSSADELAWITLAPGLGLTVAGFVYGAGVPARQHWQSSTGFVARGRCSKWSRVGGFVAGTTVGALASAVLFSVPDSTPFTFSLGMTSLVVSPGLGATLGCYRGFKLLPDLERSR